MAKFKPMPPLAELQNAFDYDPETGLFRYKRVSMGRGTQGAIAGYKTKRGYVRIGYKYVYYTAHRLAWYIVTGNDPLNRLVDHIDQVKCHNWFNNLRLVTGTQNSYNTNKRKGYTYDKNYNKYMARIQLSNGKSLWIGRFNTAEEAEQAYRKKALELRGEFAPREWL